MVRLLRIREEILPLHERPTWRQRGDVARKIAAFELEFVVARVDVILGQCGDLVAAVTA